MNRSHDSVRDELRALDAAGLRRALRVVEPAPAGPRAATGGRDVTVLCSNDYLGLATHPDVARAASDAALRFGAGSGAAQ